MGVGSLFFFFGHLVVRRLSEEFHVPAERDRRERILRFTSAKGDQFLAETEGKGKNLYIGKPCHQEVAELVHQNQQAQRDDAVNNVNHMFSSTSL